MQTFGYPSEERLPAVNHAFGAVVRRAASHRGQFMEHSVLRVLALPIQEILR